MTTFFTAKKTSEKLTLDRLVSSTSPLIELQNMVQNPLAAAKTPGAALPTIAVPRPDDDDIFRLPDGTALPSGHDSGLSPDATGLSSPLARTFSFSSALTPKSLEQATKLRTVVKKSKMQRYTEALDPGELSGTALFSLGPDHKLRVMLKNILWHPFFDLFYLVIIILWSVVMGVTDPAVKHDWYKGCNVAVAIFFSVVAALRFITLWVNEFFNSGWCILDLVVAGSVWCEIFAFDNWKISFVPFLLMRVLIPISGLFTYFTSTRTILDSLRISLAPLTYINLAMFFFFFAYAILTLQSYSNSLRRRCVVDALQTPMVPDRYCKTVNTEMECPAGATCQVFGNPEAGYDSFDNIALALLALFEIHSLDDWVHRFLTPMLESEPRYHVLTWLITGTTILFVSLIIINLFVAVICDSFADAREEDKEARREAKLLKELELRELNAAIENRFHFKPTILNIKVREFLEAPAVEWSFAAAIAGNTIAMVAESINAPQRQQDAIDSAEWVFAIVFCIELALALIAYGPKYLTTAYNFVDAGVIIINLLTTIFPHRLHAVSAIAMVRNIRIAMLFRPLRRLVDAVLLSVETTINMALVMVMSIIAFAIVGKQLFANQMPNTRSNFDNVPMGFFTLFQIISGDDWLQSMFAAIEPNGDAEAVGTAEDYTRICTVLVFYILFFVWGNYIVTNLLIGCILENFKIDEDESGTGDDDDDYKDMKMSANRYRNFIQRVVRHPRFEQFAVAAVLASSLLMCLTGPPGREDIVLSKSKIDGMGVLFTIIFVVECIMKIIALNPKGYFTNGWNLVDFIALALTLIDTIGNLPGGRVFRALRIVRSLKVVGKNEDMKNVINAVILSLKTMFYVILLYLTLVLMFALFGRNFFGGKLMNCVDTDSIVYPLGKAQCLGSYPVALAAGNVLMPRSWVNPATHFDTASDAFITLYIQVHGIWTGTCFTGMDVTEKDAQPVKNNSWGYSFFFILFQFVARFFVASLFVAVIIEYYQKVQEKTKPTELQRDWNHTMQVEVPRHLFRTIREPSGARRKLFFQFVRSGILRTAAIVVVSINCLFLCSYHNNMRDFWKLTLMWVDIWCVIFYLFEMVMKMTAYGFKTWSSQPWYILEAIIAIIAAIALIPEYAYGRDWGTMLGRIFRIFRVLRFIDFISSLRFLFRTMAQALLPLLNVLVLIFIVHSIFAVVGVNIFGNVRQGSVIKTTDFGDFVAACSILFQTLTGDSWDGAMADTAVGIPFCTPDDLDKNFYGDCGSSVAYPFYVLYTLMEILVMLNVLVAVIVNQFASYYQRLKQSGVMDPDVMDLFKEYWDFAEFRINQDKYGGNILVHQLDLFLARTNHPLTLRSGLRLKARVWPRMNPAPLFYAKCVRAELLLNKLGFLDRRVEEEDRERRKRTLKTWREIANGEHNANFNTNATTPKAIDMDRTLDSAGNETNDGGNFESNRGGENFETLFSQSSMNLDSSVGMTGKPGTYAKDDDHNLRSMSSFLQSNAISPSALNSKDENVAPVTPGSLLKSSKSLLKRGATGFNLITPSNAALKKARKPAQIKAFRRGAGMRDNLKRQLKISRRLARAEAMLKARLIDPVVTYEEVLRAAILWMVGDATAVPRDQMQIRHDTFEAILMHVAASDVAALARGSFIRAQLKKVNAAKVGSIQGNWGGIKIPRPFRNKMIGNGDDDEEPEVRAAAQSTISAWQGMASRNSGVIGATPKSALSSKYAREDTEGPGVSRQRRPVPRIETPPAPGMERFLTTPTAPALSPNVDAGGPRGASDVIRVAAGPSAPFHGFVRPTGDDDFGGSFLPAGSTQAPAPRVHIQSAAEEVDPSMIEFTQVPINNGVRPSSPPFSSPMLRSRGVPPPLAIVPNGDHSRGIVSPPALPPGSGSPVRFIPTAGGGGVSADIYNGTHEPHFISQRGDALRGGIGSGGGGVPIAPILSNFPAPPPQVATSGWMGPSSARSPRISPNSNNGAAPLNTMRSRPF